MSDLRNWGRAGWPGLVDEEMDVFGHEDVGVDAGLMTGASLFEDGFERGFGFGLFEVGETVEAAEGDEVERFGLLEPL